MMTSSCVELKGRHALAYVLSHEGSRSWEVGFKTRIQHMALSRGHDGLMCWALVDQGLEHASKWRIHCVSQDIVIEHGEDQVMAKVVFKVWSEEWSCESWAFGKCVLEKWRLCEHSCLPPIHHHNEVRRKDTRLIKTKDKYWIQVDQLTKHIWCTKWDQVISWYGKHLSIVLCELTHYICVWCFYMWLGIFPWACIKRNTS